MHLRDLPRDHRGFPVPAEAPWTADGPVISKVDPILKLLLAAHRSCAVCGYGIPDSEPSWRIYDQTSRETTHMQIAKDAVTDNDVPGHFVCMLYSALVCPFWRTENARLGRDSMFTPGARRGEEPALMGFESYAILIDPTRPFGGDDSQPLPIVLDGYVGELAFRDPQELADRYERERVNCGGRYARGKRRHYAPAFGGRPRLDKEGRAVVAALSRDGADETVDYEGVDHGLKWSGWM